jgi:hypothetical protein
LSFAAEDGTLFYGSFGGVGGGGEDGGAEGGGVCAADGFDDFGAFEDEEGGHAGYTYICQFHAIVEDGGVWE